MRKLIAIAIFFTLAGCAHVSASDQSLSAAVLTLDTATLAVYRGPWATLTDGVCDQCKAAGRKSRVYLSGGIASTLAYCGSGYYSETGAYVAPSPCNTSSQSWECSMGHRGVHTWASY